MIQSVSRRALVPHPQLPIATIAIRGPGRRRICLAERSDQGERGEKIRATKRLDPRTVFILVSDAGQHRWKLLDVGLLWSRTMIGTATCEDLLGSLDERRHRRVVASSGDLVEWGPRYAFISHTGDYGESVESAEDRQSRLRSR